MKIIETDIKGDHRGYFMETYSKQRYMEADSSLFPKVLPMAFLR